MKITRLRIRNYRGLEDLDAAIPPAGALVQGDNAQGKTSLLHAVQAALQAQDVAADAIRLGADRAEILVDIDDLSIRRLITPKNSTITVEREGAVYKAPVSFLRDLLGASSLDPMDLLTLKDKQRTEAVLRAIDVRVTVEQLRKWVPRLPDTFDCSDHGLVVVQRLHDKAYAQRKDANALAKQARTEADRLAKELRALPVAEPVNLDLLKADYESVKARIQVNLAVAAQAQLAQERTAKVREQIMAVREEAAMHRANAAKCEYTPNDYADASRAIEDASQRIFDLERQLEGERANKAKLEKMRDTYESALAKQQNHLTQAANLDGTADDLEATMKLAATQAPDPEMVAQDEQTLLDLRGKLEAGREANRQSTARMLAGTQAAVAEDDAKAKEAEAARLDGVVRALATEAPAELLASSGGIPGLSIRGDEVWMDGKSLDALSGAEQLRFCVEVAKRANAKSKILVVDGLERISPSRQEAFLRECVREKWQVLAAKVADGALTIEAIADDESSMEGVSP